MQFLPDLTDGLVRQRKARDRRQHRCLGLASVDGLGRADDGLAVRTEDGAALLGHQAGEAVTLRGRSWAETPSAGTHVAGFKVDSKADDGEDAKTIVAPTPQPENLT